MGARSFERGPHTMTPKEFQTIRLRLGLRQDQLATMLGYKAAVRISEFERQHSTPRPIPDGTARLMQAYDSGYRPSDWPEAQQLVRQRGKGIAMAQLDEAMKDPENVQAIRAESRKELEEEKRLRERIKAYNKHERELTRSK